MAEEVVNLNEIGGRNKSRPKYIILYEKWFDHVQTLKEGTGLKLVLPKESKGELPNPTTLRFAVNRFNKTHPNQQIAMIFRDSRTPTPIVYLYRKQEDEPSKDSKKSRKS
ncbi:hypothetical protein MUP77_06330 [Candidatus Bathyarchaeota archaeon]|nr:hypothetical protein [Candidatus Bathyarchaeota archaeon]